MRHKTNSRLKQRLNPIWAKIAQEMPDNKLWSITRQKEWLEMRFLKELKEVAKTILFTNPDRSAWPKDLPINTKLYFELRGGTKIIVLQEKPQVRSLWFNKWFLTYYAFKPHWYYCFHLLRINVFKKHLLNLSFPYVIFLVYFDDNRYGGLYAFYSTTGLQSINSNLLLCNLPNCDSYGGSVCLGDFKPDREAGLKEQIEKAIASFWQSMFNGRNWGSYTETQTEDKRLNIWRWSRFSRKNPNFGLVANWRQSPHVSFYNFLEEYWRLGIENMPLYRFLLDIFLKVLNKTDFMTDISPTERITEIKRFFNSILDHEAKNDF